MRRLRDRAATQEQLPDTERSARLARQVNPHLVRAATWPPLADAFAEAARAGHDLPTLLQDVLACGPLNPGHPSLDLQSRLPAGLEPEPVECHHPRQDRLLNPFTPPGSHGDRRTRHPGSVRRRPLAETVTRPADTTHVYQVGQTTSPPPY